jgi:hypothetical protein
VKGPELKGTLGFEHEFRDKHGWDLEVLLKGKRNFITICYKEFIFSWTWTYVKTQVTCLFGQGHNLGSRNWGPCWDHWWVVRHYVELNSTLDLASWSKHKNCAPLIKWVPKVRHKCLGSLSAQRGGLHKCKTPSKIEGDLWRWV